MHTCYLPNLRTGSLALLEDEAVHVGRVLRMKEGDAVRLVDGEGGEAVGRLELVSKRSVVVDVQEVSKQSHRPTGLILIVAPTKHTDRFEWLLEKATELGVEEIIPVWTERSERRVDKHVRWNKVLIAATKQCRRLWKPKFHEACPLPKLFEEHPQLRNRKGAVAHCMVDLDGAPTRMDWVQWQADLDSAWIAVGPEGDFAEAEIRELMTEGADPVHLGELRLRTETAGIAAVAQFEGGRQQA